MQRNLTCAFSILGLGVVMTTGCPADDGDDSGGGTEASSSESGGNPTSNTMSATSPDTSASADTTVNPESSGTEPGTDSTTETAGAVAQVRIVHAAPGAGNVDVYAMGNATALATDVAYGSATAYVEVPAGDTIFEIRAAGAAPEDAPLYSTEAITLEADSQSTAVAVGVIDGEAESAFRVVALDDAWGTPAAGTALVRALHAGADAPAVDIDVGNDGTPEIEGLARFEATDAAGIELPAGAAMSIGILADGARVTQFSVPALPEGATILVAATGLVVALPREPEGLGLLAVLTDAALPIIPQDPRVYALHAFAGDGAAEVDVCADTAVLVDGLTWADAATALGSFQIAPGNYDISVQADADDCGGTPLFEPVATGALAAGQQYLAVVGATNAGEPQVIVAPEEFSLDLDPAAAIHGVHAASALGTLAIGEVDTSSQIPDALLVNRANGEVVGEATLDAGTYALGVSDDNAPPLDAAGSGDVTIAGGERLWIVVAGDGETVGGGAENALRLRLVDSGTHPAPWVVTDVLLEAP